MKSHHVAVGEPVLSLEEPLRSIGEWAVFSRVAGRTMPDNPYSYTLLSILSIPAGFVKKSYS